MSIDTSYLQALIAEVKRVPEEHFILLTREEILENKELLEQAAVLFQKAYEEYKLDYWSAMKFAMRNVLEMHIPEYPEMDSHNETIAEKFEPYVVKTPLGNLVIQTQDENNPGFSISIKQSPDGPKLAMDEIMLAKVHYSEFHESIYTTIYPDAQNSFHRKTFLHDNLRFMQLETYQDFVNSNLFSKDLLDVISVAFEQKLPLEAIYVIANPKLSIEQVNEVLAGFVNGLTVQEVEKYAKSGKEPDEMKVIHKAIMNHYSPEQIDFLSDNAFTADVMRVILYAYDNKLSMERIQKYALMDFDSDELELIYSAIKNRMKDSEIALFAKHEFNYMQMSEILDGLQAKLTPEQIQIYAKPDFSFLDMMFIKEALLDGNFPEEVIRLSANSAYSRGTMNVFLQAYNQGVSIEDLSHLSGIREMKMLDEEHVMELMKAILQGASKEEIEFLANPRFALSSVNDLRNALKQGLTLEDLNFVKSIPGSTKAIRRNVQHLLSAKGMHPSLDSIVSGANEKKSQANLNRINEKNQSTDEFVK